MKYLSFIVYMPLQILAIPGAIVGILLTAYKQIIVSKRLGVSQTAIEIINGRWTMHVSVSYTHLTLPTTDRV